MAYTDAATLKQYLGITTSDDDALLTSLIARAQSAIDSYTQRTFEATSDTTKRFDALPPYVNGYVLDWSPLGLDLCQITSVTNGNGVTVTASQYTTLPTNTTPYHALRLKQYSGVTWDYTDDWEAAITITGRWAYSITPPADVVQACIELASIMYNGRESVGYKRVSVDGVGSVDYGGSSSMTEVLNDIAMKYPRLV